MRANAVSARCTQCKGFFPRFLGADSENSNEFINAKISIIRIHIIIASHDWCNCDLLKSPSEHRMCEWRRKYIFRAEFHWNTYKSFFIFLKITASTRQNLNKQFPRRYQVHQINYKIYRVSSPHTLDAMRSIFIQSIIIIAIFNCVRRCDCARNI